MKISKLSARSIVAWIIGIYAAIIFLLNLPFMQNFMAARVASVLSDELDTKVEIGNVNIGFLNRIIISDIDIQDQAHKPLLKVARVSASINVWSLINGKIDIPTAQLYGTNISLYRETPDATPNWQFVIDALTSDSEESKPLDIRVGSFVVRKANIAYNVKSLPIKANTLDPNHIRLTNAGFNLSLKHLTDDSLSVTLKRLAGKESVSGLQLKEMGVQIDANRTMAKVRNLSMMLPHSELEIDSVDLKYDINDIGTTLAFGETNIHGKVTPADIAALAPTLAYASSPLSFDISGSGSMNGINISSLKLTSSNEDLSIAANGQAHNIGKSNGEYTIYLQQCDIEESASRRMADEYPALSSIFSKLAETGNIALQGNASYQDGAIKSGGMISSESGNVSYIAEMDRYHIVDAHIEAEEIELARIVEGSQLGMASFTIDANANIDCLFNESHGIPSGNADLNISQLEYDDHTYRDITFNANSNGQDLNANLNVDDDNISLALSSTINGVLNGMKSVTMDIDLKHLNTNAFKIGEPLANKTLSLKAETDLHGSNLDNVNGGVSINDLSINDASGTYRLNEVNVELTQNNNHKQIKLNSDVINGWIEGRFKIEEIAANIQNVIARQMPALVSPVPTTAAADYNFDFTIDDAPIVHHFIDTDYSITKPIHLTGTINTDEMVARMNLDADNITWGEHNMTGVNLNCNSTRNNIMLKLSGDDKEVTDDHTTKLSIVGIARNNHLDTDIELTNKAGNDMKLAMFATTHLTDSIGNLKTKVTIAPSTLVINDTTWNISSSNLSIYKKEIACSNFKLSNGNQYIKINGKASANPSDSLVVQLNDMDVGNILDIVNFHSVEFGGKASGKAKVSNLYGKPDFNANINVKNFTLQGGHLGNADLTAFWNDEKNGIGIRGHFFDLYKCKDGHKGKMLDLTGITTVDGYISPGDNYINLGVNAQNTSTDFLNGILGDVFTEIEGRANGHLNVVGDLGDINLVGDMKASILLRLAATNVAYYVDNETVNLRFHQFDFNNIKAYDVFNNAGIINGKVTHENLANFAYTFNAEMSQLLAYNETEFNSDKYKATVFADGTLSIRGADDHPLYIDATVAPAKGSVFAYDAATPDAIASNSFIEFRDITPRGSASHMPNFTFDRPLISENADSVITAVTNENYKYVGDVYVNFTINLNPNCEVKLRMDNTDDGYISTFGNATFQAKWHNKGAFQLFGNYNITSGKYRLYLQNIVYRNLDIQEGSTVEFNGNPFEANVHLICHHEIQSVPLSDLTGTKAFSSNNKVKVICKLDVTGHLDNMNLGFDFELPNSNEEIRQLVKSMVTSDEEMNNQMIYLLGFQRFYPNQYARGNMDVAGTNAVNSLISSTISGQINQMLSNVIGRDSKWNFGTGISTGENGWEDLDVEGMLSGRLFNDRLLINGNFGYRDNAMTNQANFIGDFEVKYRIFEKGDIYVKAYNMTNDRYFTKATLNTQGIGVSFQHSFDNFRLFGNKNKKYKVSEVSVPVDSIKAD